MDKSIELVVKNNENIDRLLPITNANNIIDLSPKIAYDAMPSNLSINITLPASGSSVISPSNGWYHFRKDSNGKDQYIMLSCEENNLQDIHYLDGGQCRVNLPVSKGQKVNVWYTASGQLRTFRFIYANGSVPN